MIWALLEKQMSCWYPKDQNIHRPMSYRYPKAQDIPGPIDIYLSYLECRVWGHTAVVSGLGKPAGVWYERGRTGCWSRPWLWAVSAWSRWQCRFPSSPPPHCSEPPLDHPPPVEEEKEILSCKSPPSEWKLSQLWFAPKISNIQTFKDEK